MNDKTNVGKKGKSNIKIMIINISSILFNNRCGLNFYYISNTDRKYQPVRNENFFIRINVNTEPDFSIRLEGTLKNLFIYTFKK